jgi:hypothetical protein
MALLRFKNEKPAFGGYTYLQKETALILTADSLGELTRQVIAHRKHKSLPFGSEADVQKEIERWICGRLGSNECISEGADDPWVPTPQDSNVMSLEKIVGFSTAAWTWLKNGGEFVAKDEAQRRAEICWGCPANVNQGHECFTCSLGKLVRSAVPDDRRIAGLHSCQFCGCDLVSKVNLPDAAIIASDTSRGIQFPAFCWQAKILAKKPDA